MGWVVGFGLCQAPSSINYDCIHTILTGLIEDTPRPDPQASVWSLKGRVKSVQAKIGMMVQSFQVIKGLLTPVTPLDGSLFLASILT